MQSVNVPGERNLQNTEELAAVNQVTAYTIFL